MPDAWNNLSRWDIFTMLLIFLISIAFSIFLMFITKPKLERPAAISLGVVVALIGVGIDLIYALNKSHLQNLSEAVKSLSEKVDLHAKRGNKYYHGIANALETIVRIVNNPTSSAENLVAVAYKRLNGVRGILEKKGAEKKLEDVLNALKKEQEKFISTSVANFADWIDPEWSTYLTRQLIITSQKRDFKAERYFIYPEEIFQIYESEIEDLMACHREGKTNMISIEENDFESSWKLCMEGLLNNQNVETKLKESLNNIKQELEQSKRCIACIPDFITVGDRFWWRDPEQSWKLVEVYEKNEKEKFNAWLFFLENMQEYRSRPRSTI
ncbi:MAG: hypothetical protein J7L26_07655 [Candidatus Aminicenantes bacterium]|nr:hypothetical protein [Candidatus Aminicenantes bacterium]